MKKSLLVVALSEFQHKQVVDLLQLTKDYENSSAPSDLWRCIYNCVDLWRDAKEALDELSERGDEI